jgi:hypothetical protein
MAERSGMAESAKKLPAEDQHPIPSREEESLYTGRETESVGGPNTGVISYSTPDQESTMAE